MALAVAVVGNSLPFMFLKMAQRPPCSPSHLMHAMRLLLPHVLELPCIALVCYCRGKDGVSH